MHKMLPTDIIQLIMTYSTPQYKLPDWIDKSLHQQILNSDLLGSNPRATRYIRKNLPKYSIAQLASNPDPHVIHKVMMFSTFDPIGYYEAINLMKNPSTDKAFLEWAERKICEVIDSDVDKWARPERDAVLISFARINKFKGFYDKYLKNSQLLWTNTFNSTYPYFIDASEEVNEQYFIHMLMQCNTTDKQVQKVPAPLIIKKLEIMCGLAVPSSISDPKLSEQLGLVIGEIDPFYLSQNPGAIHILKARPGLINVLNVLNNPKVSVLIDAGVISSKINALWRTLQHNDPELVKIIGSKVKEPIKNIDTWIGGAIDLKNLLRNNNYMLEPDKSPRFFRRVIFSMLLKKLIWKI